jgi:hypothetical protein
MKKQKGFDCVRMKWDIQQKIADEFSGFSDTRMHDIQKKQIAQNPILGKFVRRVRVIQADFLTSVPKG